MLLPRIIPCLLLKGQGLVKGIQFANHKYIGDPINAVQIFNTMEADEIIFLDINATAENRIPDLNLIQKIADQCLMPFGVGGGIKTVTDARKILSAGAEKVCINTEALENPKVITAISQEFGNQSLVVSLDIKRKNNTFEIYTRCGKRLISNNLEKTIKMLEEHGVGEILVNSIDKDGTMTGYDLDLLKNVVSHTSVPVIACGGAGSIDDLKSCLKESHVSAVAAGSLFVFHGPRKAVLISYPNQNELEYIRGK